MRLRPLTCALALAQLLASAALAATEPGVEVQVADGCQGVDRAQLSRLLRLEQRRDASAGVQQARVSVSCDGAVVTLQVEDFYAAMAEGHFCCTCSVAIRRDVIREAQLRFPTGEQLGEDLDVTFRAGEFAPVGLDPRPLVVYRDSNLGLRLSRTVARKLLIPVFERLDARLASGQFPAALRAGVKLSW